jgi:glutaredoxin
MANLLVAYTMKGCHWCTEFKKQLKENKIKFKERDIEKYEEE